MPSGHRRWPSTAFSSTEDHPAERGCCIDRRLIVVGFINSWRQHRTPRRPRRAPGDRRRRRTPGRARRRGRRGWLLCHCWRSNAAPPPKSENRDPALFSASGARPRFAYRPLSPLAADGHGAAGFRRRQGQGGGCQAVSRHFDFGVKWPIDLESCCCSLAGRRIGDRSSLIGLTQVKLECLNVCGTLFGTFWFIPARYSGKTAS